MEKTFGTPDAAIKAAEHFRQELGYPSAKPVKFTIQSPGKRNKIVCYGIFYNRPEYRNGDWFYMLINRKDLKSVYSRKHYYSLMGRDWYIAGYTTDTSLEEQYARYNPFGHNVGMTAWDMDRYPIDTNRWGHILDYGTYPRLPILITYLLPNETVN